MANDPYDAFDPELAAMLRNAFDHEIGQRLQPFTDAQADREVAQEETRLRAIYPDYDKQRAKVLAFAIDNDLDNLDLAYRAYRGSTAPAGTAPQAAAPSAEQRADADAQAKFDARHARIEELQHKDGSEARDERLRLQRAERDDMEGRLLEVAKSVNAKGGDDELSEAGREYTFARNARLADGESRRKFDESEGRRTPDGKRRDRGERPVTREERAAAMDYKVLEVLAGKSDYGQPHRQSRADRDAELNGLTNAERAIVGSTPAVTHPNANAVAQQIAHEQES